MAKKRRSYTPEFKFRVALEAMKGMKTIVQIAQENQVHPNQVRAWKKQLQESGSQVFSKDNRRAERVQQRKEEALYEQIGRLQMELAWLNKKLPTSTEAKRGLIEPDHAEISLRRQCELVGLSRSSLYYQPVATTVYNLELMSLIDAQYLQTPFYGRRKMTRWLRKQGHWVNEKRTGRLMRLMGLIAMTPRPRTSHKAHGHRIYPYLLKNVPVERPNQVWSADITYIPMPHDFMYLVAIMDWHSRYVLVWALSNTLERHFCLEALDMALTQEKPEIFNTDQGAQFTSMDFTSQLEQAGIRISMDGRGRVFDNIFIGRLWRTVKYEHIYLYRHETVPELYAGLTAYFRFYNHERFHQSLNYQTPAQVYFGPEKPLSGRDSSNLFERGDVLSPRTPLPIHNHSHSVLPSTSLSHSHLILH